MSTTTKKDIFLSEPGTRYQCLLTLIDKALGQSRKSFDTEKAVKDCYGEDVSMFEASATTPRGESKEEDNQLDDGNNDGDDSNKKKGNMLIDVVDDMVVRVNERVKEEMVQWLQDHGVGDKLTLIETIVTQLDQEDAKAAQAELEDRQSARRALEAVKLPKDVSPSDVMRYHAFQVMEQERDSLLEELHKVDQEIKALEQRQSETTAQVEGQLKEMERVEQELERTANICSMGASAGTNHPLP